MGWGSVLVVMGWMHWPVARDVSAVSPLTQGYYGDYIGYCGARDDCGTHNGYDYGVSNVPLYAVAPGVVDLIHDTDTGSAEYGGAGLWVRVRHDETTVPGLDGAYYVAMLHMSRIDVAVGQAVDSTTMLGVSGSTGGVAAHLHLHVSRDGAYCAAPIDPGCPTAPWVAGSVIPETFSDAPGCQSRCAEVTSQWIAPAAYGGEVYGGVNPCGELTYAGQCAGELLRFCESFAVREVDCAADGRVCGYADDAIGNDCLDCTNLPAPRCDGSRWLRCEGEQARATDCAAEGAVCTEAGCVPVDAAPGPDAGDPGAGGGTGSCGCVVAARRGQSSGALLALALALVFAGATRCRSAARRAPGPGRARTRGRRAAR